jgi:hypothetical protein
MASSLINYIEDVGSETSKLCKAPDPEATKLMIPIILLIIIKPR